MSITSLSFVGIEFPGVNLQPRMKGEVVQNDKDEYALINGEHFPTKSLRKSDLLDDPHRINSSSPAAMKEKSSPVKARRPIEPNTFSMLEKECGDLKRALKEAELVVDRGSGVASEFKLKIT